MGVGSEPMVKEADSGGGMGDQVVARDHVPAAVATSCGLIPVNPVCHALICIAVTKGLKLFLTQTC